MTESVSMTVAPPSTPVAWEAELKGAQYLLKSGLCPVALKTPEAVLFTILAGRDLGLSPVASLRGLSIIQGKLEVSADLQLGLFHRAGGKSEWSCLSDAQAILILHAPWLTKPHSSSFSMNDAKRAGIATGNYQKYPKAMLRSRAITQGLKDIGFDATAGVYAPGEIGGPSDVVDGEAVVIAAEETGEAPTESQLSLLSKALKSAIWTDDERDEWSVKADGATRGQLAVLLDEMIAAGRAKKERESFATVPEALAVPEPDPLAVA